MLQVADLPVLFTVCAVRFKTFVYFVSIADCRMWHGFRLPHVAWFLFCAHIAFPFSLLVLYLSKYDCLLKFLLHDTHGIRTLVNAHGGVDMQ